MKLLSYEAFGRLRLAKWFPDSEFLEDSDSFYRLIHESERGLSFVRSMNHPEETLSMNIDLLDSHPRACQEILAAIECPLKAGISPEQLKAQLGTPESHNHSHLNKTTILEFITDAPAPYALTCICRDGQGLVSITIRRLDIPWPKSQEEQDSPPSQHRWLTPFEASPQNVSSPESIVSCVSLNLQSAGNFLYRIHLRNQKGMTYQGAALHIKRPGTEHVTTIVWLRPPAPGGFADAELDGYLDKDLVRLAHVRMTFKDEIQNTSQDVIVEFDRFYGIAPPPLR